MSAYKSFSPKAPPRFWAAFFILCGLLLYLGVQWIPLKRSSPPAPKILDVQAQLLSLEFLDLEKAKFLEISAQILPVRFSEPGPLDLNRASAAELEKLPGIGPVLAQRIVEWRETHGPFKSVEDLLAIPGIGAKTLEKLRDLVTVTPP